jgi:hypothetical protein
MLLSWTSDPEPIRRQVFDTGASDTVVRIFADIDAAENHLFVVLTVALPVAFALLSISVRP